MGTVYLIRSPCGKSYIGATRTSIEDRWAAHVHQMRYNRRCNGLHEAMRHYDLCLFSRTALIVCDDDNLLLYEELAIKALGTLHPMGFNRITSGPDYMMSDATKTMRMLGSARHGEALRGQPQTSESNAKRSESLSGVAKSEAHREALREAWKTRSRIVSDAAKQAMSLARKGKAQSEAWIAKRTASMRLHFALRPPRGLYVPE